MARCTMLQTACGARAGAGRALDVCVLENGDVGELDEAGLAGTTGRIHAGRVHVFAGRALPNAVLDERLALASRGVAHVTVPIDGGRIGEVAFTSRGVLDDTIDGQLVAAARVEALAAARPLCDVQATDESIAEAVRQVVRRVLGRALGFKPTTLVTIVRGS
jgi:mRNA degradation ribonuclease J1/J2